MKKWYKSTTIWVNLLMAAAYLVAQHYHQPVPTDQQTAITFLVNVAWRFFTKEAITF